MRKTKQKTTSRTLLKTGKNAIAAVRNAGKSLQEYLTSDEEFQSLNELLKHEIQDLYSAENQLVKALPKMAQKASSQSLKKAFSSHLTQTKEHVKRLEDAARILKIKLSGKTCKAMEGLVKEGNEIIKGKGKGAVIDTALIAAAQRVEHYEIAGYGCVRTMADQLRLPKVSAIFQKTLNEEAAADKKLTSIAEKDVLKSASKFAKSRTKK